MKASGLVSILLAGVAAVALNAAAAETLPKAPEPFKGRIDPERDKSTPAWPQAVKVRQGAPNVLLVLLDDAGFAGTSTFGGAVATPELDQLASQGLRYNRFHATGLCSPTRASLLTGRNHHQVGFGTVADIGSGYPGYNSVWNRETATVAEVLRQNGYSTAAFGKWHNTPSWEINPSGPFDRWPTSQGFEYFYGFLAGLESQFEARLIRNLQPAESLSESNGLHLTTALANDAIKWLGQHESVAPDKPFFLYFAPGATHWPHQAPKEWIDKFKGKFDQGWDKLREENFARQKQAGIIPADAALSPRPAEIPAWDSFDADQKRLLARQAEVNAGFMAHTDHEIGRVLAAIRAAGKADNTLVVFITGDNGAPLSGGPTGLDVRGPDGKNAPLAERLKRLDEFGSEKLDTIYAAGWGWAENTPFQYGKSYANHLGGTRNGLVVSWPAGIKDKGGVRQQFGHVNDIAPTLYEVAGISFPSSVNGVKQLPLEGASLAASFADAKAPERHTRQYFEMVGNHAVYKDGWWASRRYQGGRGPVEPGKTAGLQQWELYNLTQDYSESRNLADQNPAKVKELAALFDAEAKRNQVYPLAPIPKGLPSPADGRTHFTYGEGSPGIPGRATPNFAIRSHTITAQVEAPAAGSQGVIVARGGRWGGFSLYVKDGKLVYETNAFGNVTGKVVSSEPLPAGKSQVVVEVALTNPPAEFGVFNAGGGPGTAAISVNGKQVASGSFQNLTFHYNETLDLGRDVGSPVTDEYRSPYAFTGRVEKVDVTLR